MRIQQSSSQLIQINIASHILCATFPSSAILKFYLVSALTFANAHQTRSPMASITAASNTSTIGDLSSDSSSSTMTAITLSLPTIFNISHMINTPLDSQNYLCGALSFKIFLTFKTFVLTIRDQIHTLKHDSDKPITEYLLHAKSLFDSLATTCAALNEAELIDYILAGLGQEHKAFKTFLHLRTSISFDDFYDLLI